MAKFVIYEEFEDEEPIFEDFELLTNRILMGTSEENNLVLDAPDIDPTHASLELRDEYWTIQDMGGQYGTFVNGERIEGPYKLQEYDVVEVGPVRLKFIEYDDIDERDLDTQELPKINADEAEEEVYISGRAWFATLAGGTLIVILIILLLLVMAQYFGMFDITDIFPKTPTS